MKTATRTIFRSATSNDCNTIAQLMRIASDGVSEYVWSTLTDEYRGLTPIEIGVKRYANPNSLFSYKNCVLAEQAGETVGMIPLLSLFKKINAVVPSFPSSAWKCSFGGSASSCNKKRQSL